MLSVYIIPNESPEADSKIRGLCQYFKNNKKAERKFTFDGTKLIVWESEWWCESSGI